MGLVIETLGYEFNQIQELKYTTCVFSYCTRGMQLLRSFLVVRQEIRKSVEDI